ncbi:hypothetical protein [Ruegeria atlantica]|uniref:hypothetical protein n=1 Tax=Ruegeria atlantica TaxID=81569 RepID=UPI00147E61B3|nr:hypothetical protein [Ruegeria atlantica]
MRFLWRWARRLVLLLVVIGIGLAAPVLYVETMCRGDGTPEPYEALIDADYHRPESRTLMTYPEWHIVHAYEDYAKTLKQGDPHDYGFLSGIAGFWTSLCALSETASAHGGIDGGTKQMVYVIGTSFTAELALKAAYEETIGRVFVALRGPQRAQLDDLSAQQATKYAAFLQQVPWYKWPFSEDAQSLRDHPGDTLRDNERRAALGLEYAVKDAYAGVIEQAVAQVGADELTLRMIVTATTAPDLVAYTDVRTIGSNNGQFEIETPRYRALTKLLKRMALDGVDVLEMAGNDEILFTAISDRPSVDGAIFSAQRQGFGDYRHLIVVKVPHLMQRLREMEGTDLRLEHIHDY